MLKFLYKYYLDILIVICLCILSTFFIKWWHFSPLPALTELEKKQMAKPQLYAHVIQNQINAELRRETDCSKIRELMKKRLTQVSIAFLEKELAKVKNPHEFENMKKIVKCLKENYNDKQFNAFKNNRRKWK